MMKSVSYQYQFANHVIDWYLWKAIKAVDNNRPYLGVALGLRAIDYETFDPEDWTRYDGELL